MWAGLNYTINCFSPKGADAMMAYWDENVLTDDVMEPLGQIDEAGRYMDSLELMTGGENSTRQLWCGDMLTQFSSRRGYGLTAWLPLLIRETPDILGGMGQYLTYVYDFTDTEAFHIDHVRCGFFQTETELCQENCLEPLHTWLNEKGLVLRSENSYGKTVESTADAYEALTKLGVRARAENTESTGTILTTMRKAGDATYLYVYNDMYEDEAPYEGRISVKGTFLPCLLDTWSGKVKACNSFTAADGRTELAISRPR